MKPISYSSGDLLVDRRSDYAEMLFAAGDRAAAADLLRDALELAPGWAAGWFRLGEMREAAGDLASADAAWRETLRIDPADRLGATLKLGLIGAAHAIEATPSAFVEALFDQYADRFDRSLVEKLGYTVPERLVETLRRIGGDGFAHVVDLGCGTGLMGERLRGVSSYLEGHDISAGMLAKAQAKRVYDRLDRTDLQLLEPGARRADLVVAADVFMYLGALDRMFASVAAMNVANGLFAFSVERHPGPEDMVLLPSRRYAHSRAYLDRLLAAHGFETVSGEEHVIRCDRGDPIVGLLVVARQTGRPASAAAPTVATVDEASALHLH